MTVQLQLGYVESHIGLEWGSTLVECSNEAHACVGVATQVTQHVHVPTKLHLACEEHPRFLAQIVVRMQKVLLAGGGT